jgi:peptidoglycan hydrolase-like protein with peptidoglycan-binding domain
MNSYVLGTLVLGADVVPKAGAVYTDYDTVLAVQKALKAKGFDPKEIDGRMGPDTAGAIRAMQAALGVPQTGVIDYGVLMALGVQAPTTSKPTSSSSSSAPAPRTSYSPAPFGSAPSASSYGPPGAAASWWSQPLWDGAPIKRWQAGVGVGAGAALIFGLLRIRRR